MILFGSHACGRPDADSDVDLLVVMPYDGNELEKMVEVRRELDSSLPVDVLVKSPEQISERLKTGDFFLREIVEKGELLYESGNR